MDKPVQDRLQLSISQLSVVGPKPNNEDCIGVRLPDGAALRFKGAVAAIADGVSSAEAGQEASHTAVQSFLSDYYSTPETWPVKTSAHRVLIALNRWLYNRSQQFSHQLRQQHKGYLCTLSVLIFKGHSAYCFHIGDARIYRLRDGELECLTQDHRLQVSDTKSYLARALGMNLHLDVDFKQIDVRVGDRFCLCTDGLHEFVSEQTLQSVLATDDDWDGNAQRLIDAAADSDDNISCQLLRVDAMPTAEQGDWHHALASLPFAPYLYAGMTLDGLRLEKELHSGPRSEVFLVSNIESGRKHVMKVASRSFEDDPHYIEHFATEEWIGRRLKNTHVVSIDDPPQQRSCLYYLSEYLPGLSLQDWIHQHPKPSVQRIYPIVEQIAKAVTALHRAETLHQDLKPDNFMFDGDGELKLIDFGSCRVAGIHPVNDRSSDCLGTAHYSAPEYRLQRNAGFTADYFSVGVMVYRMLCGKLPYGEAYAQARSPADFAKLSYTSMLTHNPLVPTWVDGAVRKLVSLSPEHRYRELSEFIADIKHPNAQLIDSRDRPLLERNPLAFWKGLSAALGGVCLVLFYLAFLR